MASSNNLTLTQILLLDDKITPETRKVLHAMEGLEAQMKDVDKAIERAFDDGKKSVKGFGVEANKAFSGISGEIPMLGRLGPMLTNPFVLAGASIAATGAALVDVIGRAFDFQKQFTAIRQLNLDKPLGAMQAYNDVILQTAMDAKIGAEEAAIAFYDVQSATGLFGDEAAKVVDVIGTWSQVTGSDLKSQINSTVKAMNAFGLGADDVTTILAAQNAAVQFGVTTQEEYGRVLTEFAGTAASAGQDISSASGLFAAFSKTAKDSNIAATMTKTALQGLTTTTAANELKKIGVSLYDAAGGMRGLDQVLAELAPRLQGMTDQQFSAFRQAVGGPEGMAELLNMAKVQGDGLAKTLTDVRSGMDNFNLANFEALAKDDPAKMWAGIKAQLDVLLTKMAQVFLPLIAKFLEWISQCLDDIFDAFQWVNGEIQKMDPLIAGVESIVSAIGDGFDIVSDTIGSMSDGLASFYENSQALQDVVGFVQEAWAELGHMVDWTMDMVTQAWDQLVEAITWGLQPIMDAIDVVMGGIGSLSDVMADAANWLDGLLGYDTQKVDIQTNDISNTWVDDAKKANAVLASGKMWGGAFAPKKAGAPAEASPAAAADIAATANTTVAGAGQTVRNITINMENLVGSQNFYAAQGQPIEQMASQTLDPLSRVLRDATVSLN